jgi:cytochrome c peroxidase
VAGYFSGDVHLLAPDTGRVLARIALGPQAGPDPVRRGEAAFHDATFSLQQWFGCSTCHPDGRVDGLNWDLMNDGLGNSKNTKSLLLAHRTPPAMARAVRATMEVAVLAGFRHTQSFEPDPADVEAVRAYIRSLRPVRNPRVGADGGFSPMALRGKTVFERPDVGCAECHPAPLFSDLQQYDVGTGTGPERGVPIDTPTLIELWRTAPYLHHGRAATLREVLTVFNRDQRHGATASLTAAELDSLVEYLLAL